MSLSHKATPGVALTYTLLFLALLLNVSAHAQLKADFTPSKTSDCESLITKFNDNSTGNPVSWQWTLGNGATSTEQSPSASYTTPGTYKVTLTVKNSAGIPVPPKRPLPYGKSPNRILPPVLPKAVFHLTLRSRINRTR